MKIRNAISWFYQLKIFVFCFLCPILHAERIDILFYFDTPSVFLKAKTADFTIRPTQIEEYETTCSPYDPELKKIIFWNNSENFSALEKLPKDKMVLFLWEPRKLPSSWYDYYSRVYTWDDDLVDGVKFFKFYYPYLLPSLDDLPSFEEKKLCTMIATYHGHKDGNVLYHERKLMIDFFETKPEEEFDLYGSGWTNFSYRSYRGTIPGSFTGLEKLTVLKNYRFAICFENSKNLNGYITEKIFCCFAAGVLPIYWGAENIENYIPKECYIDFRDFPDKETLYQYIKTMPKEVYEQHLVHIRAFLLSEKAQLFSPDHFDQIFYEAISN